MHKGHMRGGEHLSSRAPTLHARLAFASLFLYVIIWIKKKATVVITLIYLVQPWNREMDNKKGAK